MSRRLKLSRVELAEALLLWIAMHIGREGIEHDAKVFDFTSESPLESREAKELFGLSLSNTEEFTILFEELMALNLWIVVAACEGTFKDVEQRNYCLDLFHRRFFDQFVRETNDDFEQWLRLLTVKYDEYRKAWKNGIQALAWLIQRNLHREDFPGVFDTLQIAIYVGEALKALGKTLDQYKIE